MDYVIKINKVFLFIISILSIFFSKKFHDSFLFPKEFIFLILVIVIYFNRFIYLLKNNKISFFKINFIDFSIFLMLFFISLSIILNYETSYLSLNYFVLTIAAVTFYFEIRLFYNTKFLFFKLLDGFIISGVLCAIYSLMQYYYIDIFFAPYVPTDKMRMFSFFGNKNYLSEYLCAIVWIIFAKISILTLIISKTSKNKKLNKFYLLINFTFLFIVLISIFLIQSRASWIAIFVSLIFIIIMILKCKFWYLLIKKFQKVLISFFVLVLFFIFLYSFNSPITIEKTNILERISSIFNFLYDRNAIIRFDIWHASILMIKEHFWFGCGFNNFKNYYLTYQGILLNEKKSLFYEPLHFAKANQAHNEFIQWFCEVGIFGFLFSIIFVFFLGKIFFKIIKISILKYEFIIFVSLFALLITILINSLFGFPLHVLPTAILTLTTLAIISLIYTKYSYLEPIKKYVFKYNFKIILFLLLTFYVVILLLLPNYLLANYELKAGLDYLKLNNYNLAINHLQKSILYNPNNGEPHYYLGICYMQQKKYDEAIMEFLKSIQTESDPNIYANIGLAFYKIGMYDYAKKYFEKSISISPHNPYYLINLGCVYQKLNDFKNAIYYFQLALSFCYSYEALINIGHSYYLMGIYDKALQTLNNALSQCNLNSIYAERIYFLKGLINMELKNFKDAVNNINLALTFNPSNIDYNLNLGLSLIFDGKTNEAELLFGNFLKNNFDELIAYNLASLYFNENRFNDALILLNKLKYTLENKYSSEILLENKIYQQTIKLLDLIKIR